MTKLRIIKRDDEYVVQIGVKRKFVFDLRVTWIDLEAIKRKHKKDVVELDGTFDTCPICGYITNIKKDDK